jgi:uncharacterized membrane protein YbhN (UPF0104 family)
MKAMLPPAPRTLVAAAGVLALLACVAAGLVLWAGWQDVARAVERIDPTSFALALATSLVCYGIRFLRWQAFCVILGHRVPWLANLKIYLAGLGFTWTPAKSGELARGAFLTRYDVPLSRTLLLFYWDRLSDLAGMLMLALVATLALASAQLVLLPAALLILVALWLLRPGGPLFSRAIGLARARLALRHWDWVDGLARLREADAAFSVGRGAAGALAGAAAYAMQAVGMLIIAQASGIDLHFTAALMVTSVSTLAGAAVLLPAGAGVVETTSVGLLAAQGIALPDAVAIGLIHRAATFWFALALGAVALASLVPGRRKHA